MAEIKVEPKRGGMGWVWAIIILALIAAAVWYFLNDSSAAPPAPAPADSARTSLAAPPAPFTEGLSHG